MISRPSSNIRIAHISDVHVKNLSRHHEYINTFNDLEAKLEELKPDLIIDTGDWAHTKTQISPEFVALTSDFFRRLSKHAPLHRILGNHDLNLANLSRRDAISPIVEALQSDRIFLHKKSGPVDLPDLGVTLWAFSLADRENYPKPSDWANNDSINIGLYHGSVKHCINDLGFEIPDVETGLEMFDGLDYVLLGDIHRRQFFRNRTIAYAGSLVQQDHGETTDKGFLLWDIRSKTDHDVTEVLLTGSIPFVTLEVDESLGFDDGHEQARGSNLRLRPVRRLSVSEKREVERAARKVFEPKSVAFDVPKTTPKMPTVSVGAEPINLRDSTACNKLVSEFVAAANVPKKIENLVLEFERKYSAGLEQRTEIGDRWTLDAWAFSRMFQYGDDNIVDLTQMPGIIGIFGPNGIGKSNAIEAVLEGIFDKVSKGVPKNAALINDDDDIALVTVKLSDRYVIDRKIERRSKDRLSSSALCNFYEMNGETKSSLNGDSKTETEKNIRAKFGTYDDFLLHSLCAQANPLDIIFCKEADRKSIFYRWLGIDVFEKRNQNARDDDDMKLRMRRVKAFDPKVLYKEVSGANENIASFGADKAKNTAELETLKEALKDAQSKMVEVASSKKVVEGLARNFNPDAARSRLSQIWSERKRLNDDISALQSSLTAAADSTPADPGKRKLVSSELDESSRELVRLEKDASECDRQIRLLGSVPCGDAFPTCRFIADAFKAKELRPGLLDAAGRVASRVEELKTERTVLDAAQERENNTQKTNARISSVELSLAKLANEERELESSISRYESFKSVIENNNRIDRELNELKTKAKKTEAEIDSIGRLIGHLDSAIAVLERKIKGHETDLAAFEADRDECAAYELYLKATGKDGIPCALLGQYLPAVNDEIAKILSDVVDFGVMVVHDAEEQSLGIEIVQEGKSRQIELAGGGQKLIASIAIRAALDGVSVAPRSNVLIIDEGFGKLDPDKLAASRRLLQSLKSVFEHVIVISHVESMRDAVDHIIEISQTEDGRSKVECAI